MPCCSHSLACSTCRYRRRSVNDFAGDVRHPDVRVPSLRLPTSFMSSTTPIIGARKLTASSRSSCANLASLREAASRAAADTGPSELWVIRWRDGQASLSAHDASRDGISGGPGGTVSLKATRRNARVAFCFRILYDCMTVKLRTLFVLREQNGEEPKLPPES